MKLTSLKPRLTTLNTARGSTLELNPIATPRLRGRAGMERRARWLKANPLCVECKREGRTTVATVPDHKVPLWKGGPDTPENLQSLCRAHHDAKTAAEARQRAGLA